MTFDDYQLHARTTAIYKQAIVYPALGMCGEAGEVAEKVKKMVRDDSSILTEERRQAIGKEIGDVLWYAANLASDIGLSLGYIAGMNIEKLRDRAARGVLQGSGDNR